MKNLWIWYMPLLFLPNLGLDNQTKFGALKITDYLIWPYLGLLFLAARQSTVRYDAVLLKYGKYFMAWCGLGVLLMLVYYHEYRKPMLIFYFIGLKYSKFALYAIAGFYTARAICDREAIQKYHWALLLCMLITGIACLVGFRERNDFVDNVFEAANQISVILAMMLAYTIALLTADYGTANWRKAAMVCIAVSIAGIGMTGGRGGWIALIAGVAYVIFKQKLNYKTIAYFTVAPIGLLMLYNMNARFKKDWDRIFRQTDDGVNISNMINIDDGSRLGHLMSEGPKFVHAPFFGTGFFHRGGYTSLWKTGSHNFFVQILLETGIIGVYLLYTFLKRLWKTAGRSPVRYAKLSLAYRSMFIVAFLGGCSGEYYYGGRALLVFMIMYAPVGAALSMGMNREAARAHLEAA